jgi:hypothetical protein
MIVKKGQALFTVTQGTRNISFKSPVSGKVKEHNKFINNELDSLNITVYDQNWVCEIDTEELDSELSSLKIGKSAVTLFQDDIERLKEMKRKMKTGKEADFEPDGIIYSGEMEKLDDVSWRRYCEAFFEK